MRARWTSGGLIVASLVLAACGGRAPPAATAPAGPPPDAAARAAAIEAAAAQLQKVDGRWQRGQEPSRWSAYFQSGELRFLDERVTPPAGSARHNRYYFEGGRLFYFAGEAPAGRLLGGPAADAPTLPVQAEFSGARTISAVRIEHYGPVRLEERDATEIRRQATELASIAMGELRAVGTH